MNPSSLKNLRRGVVVVLRKCACCGEMKPSREFTHGRGKYALNCRDCGCWLFLFRQVFPEARSADHNERTAIRMKALYHSRRSAPAMSLWNAWNGAKA